MECKDMLRMCAISIANIYFNNRYLMPKVSNYLTKLGSTRSSMATNTQYTETLSK